MGKSTLAVESTEVAVRTDFAIMDPGAGNVVKMIQANLGGDDGGPHGEPVGGQPRLLVRFTDRGLLRGFVAVAGTARQTPGAALMTPRCAVLQQHRGRTVGARRPQQ